MVWFGLARFGSVFCLVWFDLAGSEWFGLVLLVPQGLVFV